MTKRTSLLVSFALVFLAPGVTACEGLEVESAWVRQPPPGHGHAAGYVMLRNTGDHTLGIAAVSSPDFESVALHATRYDDGKARMRPLGTVELAPGEMFDAHPGGNHLMLGGARRALSGTAAVTLVFECTDGGTLETRAPVLRRAPD